MLLIKTEIKPSRIHDIGIFAAEDIRKGTVVWKFNPLLDIKLSKTEMDSLPPAVRSQITRYTYMNADGKFLLCGDDARFFNHSGSPNCADPDEQTTIAARDIFMGEELTSDYAVIDHGKTVEFVGVKSGKRNNGKK